MVPTPFARAFFNTGSIPWVRKFAPTRITSNRLLSMPQLMSSTTRGPWLDAPVNLIFPSFLASSHAS